MTRSLSRLLASAASAACLVGSIGCGGPAPVAPQTGAPTGASHDHDHDHDHDHSGGENHGPATFAEGLTELQKAVVTITTSLTTGANDAADDAVHKVGHLLGDLETMVEKQEWTVEAKEAGRKALVELTECFDKLDQSLHAAEGKGEAALTVLGSVTERIGKAIASLGEIIQAATKQPVPTTTTEAKK